MTQSRTNKHNNAVKKRIQKAKQKNNCHAKRTYSTMEEALASSNRQHGKGLYLKPYACGICGKFHLTKRDKVSVLTDLFKAIEKERNKTSST